MHWTHDLPIHTGLKEEAFYLKPSVEKGTYIWWWLDAYYTNGKAQNGKYHLYYSADDRLWRLRIKCIKSTDLHTERASIKYKIVVLVLRRKWQKHNLN